MLLTEHNICYYLLEKGMIDLPALVNGPFTARRSDSRNNNFIINKEYDNHKLFIKQVKAQDAEKIETLRTEANCYQLAATDIQYKALKEFLPAFHYYDALNNVLIIEQVRDVLSLQDFYFQLYDFNNNLPQLLADILASYHASVNSVFQQSAFQTFRKQKPWIFTITTSAPFWPAGPQPTVEQQIVQLIFKNKEFVQLLALAEQEWQPASLTHNDVKFNNFLMHYDFDKKKINGVKLIDWELADVGDPLWDVAAVIQNFLFLWVGTDLPEQANMPQNFRKIKLEEVQPCIEQFWKRYIEQMKIDINQQQLVLMKVVKYTALKLIHACFETAPSSATLQPMSVKMLQMSLNILRAPADAAIRLLGIK